MKFLIFLVLSVFLSACTIVGPGEVGVRISGGKVSEDPKPPGMYFWMPVFAWMANVDVQIQKTEVESTAASKDMQDVFANVALNWSLSPEKVVSTYKSIGDEGAVYNRIIMPAVNEVMKSACAKRTAEQVLTHRMEMKNDIDEGLKQRLEQYGVTLHDVNIVNLQFSKGFAEAIEHKQIAEQQAQQAVYVAQKATQEAKAEVERAKGQAASQNLIRASITPEILQQRAIEKWNGQFPQVMGSGALPFINLKVN